MVKFRSMKVFDIVDLPDELEAEVAFYFLGCFGAGNGSYVSWTIEDWTQNHENDDILALSDLSIEQIKAVDEWLLIHGAELGDKILFYIWR